MKKPRDTAWESAAIGVVGAGSIRQCIHCRDAAGPEEMHCHGFGPGCFLPPAQRVAVSADPEPFTGFRTEALKEEE